MHGSFMSNLSLHAKEILTLHCRLDALLCTFNCFYITFGRAATKAFEIFAWIYFPIGTR